MRTTIFSIAFAVAILCSSCTVKANPTTLITQPMNDEVESIIKEFKSGDNVTYVNLPKTLIKLGLKAADDETANALAEQIDGLQSSLKATRRKCRALLSSLWTKKTAHSSIS